MLRLQAAELAGSLSSSIVGLLRRPLVVGVFATELEVRLEDPDAEAVTRVIGRSGEG